MIPVEVRILRIHVDASERRHGRPLYEAIVARARAMHLAGASVFPVEMSFGSHRAIHDAASDYGFVDLPVVIEVVDAPDRIEALLADLGALIAGASVTVRPARMLRPHHAEGSPR